MLTTTIKRAVETLDWESVPLRAIDLFEKCADTAVKARRAIEGLPQEGFLDLWYSKDHDKLRLNVGDWMDSDALQEWRDALAPLVESLSVVDEAGSKPTDDDGEGDWVKVAFRSDVVRGLCEKSGASPSLNFLGKNLNFIPGGVLPVKPSPLSSGLASGMLGAGLGYGTGWLAETLLPDRWKKKKLRRSLAILGGLGALVPSAVWAGHNVYAGRGWNDGSAAAPPEHGVSLRGLPAEADLVRQRKGWEDHRAGYKEGSATGFSGDWPTIDVPSFNQALWNDPLVYKRMNPQTQAAATGLVTGAAHLGGTRFVSPGDVARMTAGMGTGYLSGAAVGKVLGALTGMPEPVQNRLKQTGLWAGIVSNVVPIAFR